MTANLFRHPGSLFQIQKVMMRVCYALVPLVAASIYLFGWRSLVLTAVVLVFAVATEALFTLREKRPVTSAVFVTALIFSLSMPPSVPFWIAVIGIVAGVSMGKMAFGGFGRNVFNPAMVGRCFIYITFPAHMTGTWVLPMWGGAAGLGGWSNLPDAVTRATPLVGLRTGISVPLWDLFIGDIPGSMGETSALLIILGGIYLFYTRAASYRLSLSCLLGGTVLSAVLHWTGSPALSFPLAALLSGSFLFGTVFVVTEPVSAAKTPWGQWVYGFMVGGLTVVLRAFSNFSDGLMFSILLMNAFAPILDRALLRIRKTERGTP